MAAPFSLKWGILATGGIAETFAKDLLTNPATRSVSEVSHIIAAVASSSSAPRAADFLARINHPSPSSVNVYGSYSELVADASIDIIYVATPHSHHFQNAMLALSAGKHVLCEKALAVTASQARKLVETAREKKLFFMEAVWTRYFPLSQQIRARIAAGEIGTVHRVVADFSFNNSAPDLGLTFPDDNRMVDLAKAGGALLDLGVYSLTWVFQAMYHVQPADTREKPTVTASVIKYDRTGADETTTVVLTFPRAKAVGVAMTTLRAESAVNGRYTGDSAAPTVRIQGSGGEIAVYGVAAKPSQYRVLRRGKDVEVVDCPFPKDAARNDWGHGMYWEADEAARCVRDGKLESEGLPHEESVAIMEVMEETLRIGGVVYPKVITTDVFDKESPLNTGKG